MSKLAQVPHYYPRFPHGQDCRERVGLRKSRTITRGGRTFQVATSTAPDSHKSSRVGILLHPCVSVAPVAYQVILEPGIGQFREFECPQVHARINSWGLFLVHRLTCGKRESVS